jgi:hypothetical protein
MVKDIRFWSSMAKTKLRQKLDGQKWTFYFLNCSANYVLVVHSQWTCRVLIVSVCSEWIWARWLGKTAAWLRCGTSGNTKGRPEQCERLSDNELVRILSSVAPTLTPQPVQQQHTPDALANRLHAMLELGPIKEKLKSLTIDVSIIKKSEMQNL